MAETLAKSAARRDSAASLSTVNGVVFIAAEERRRRRSLVKVLLMEARIWFSLAVYTEGFSFASYYMESSDNERRKEVQEGAGRFSTNSGGSSICSIWEGHCSKLQLACEMNSSRARQIRAALKIQSLALQSRRRNSLQWAALVRQGCCQLRTVGAHDLFYAKLQWKENMALFAASNPEAKRPHDASFDKVCTVDSRPFCNRQCNGPLEFKSICWPKKYGPLLQ
uniref:Uncharacterized protein n=1 Tax=Ananas comosus var. bracteatus TaxID=296719 RepID=A0A6V7QGC6_ANACO|nr:unnamed protein product [Ananas comosus var. bracteatus]